MSFLSEDIRQKIIAELPKYPTKRAVTLPALHHVQDALRCVPLDAIKEIADILDQHPAEVHDTMSFYGFFRDPEHKLGKNRLQVCRSLSCMLRGGEEVLAESLADPARRSRFLAKAGHSSSTDSPRQNFSSISSICSSLKPK